MRGWGGVRKKKSKFNVLRFSLGGEGRGIWQEFFCRDFLGIQNNLKIRGSARVSRPRSSANKVQPNLFCVCFNI